MSVLTVTCNNTTYCVPEQNLVYNTTCYNHTVSGVSETVCNCLKTHTLCVTCNGKNLTIPTGLTSGYYNNANCVNASCCTDGICYISTQTTSKKLKFVCNGTEYYALTNSCMRKGIPPGLYSGPHLYELLCKMIGCNTRVKTCGSYKLGNLYMNYPTCVWCCDYTTFCCIGTCTGTFSSCCCSYSSCWVEFSNGIWPYHYISNNNTGVWYCNGKCCYCRQLKANNIINSCLYMVCILTPIILG